MMTLLDTFLCTIGLMNGKISYIFRGSVANMLITSCKDNVCRIWSETILPDDGLLDLEQFDPSASFDPKFHTHRHKKRFLQRLKTIR